jgi:class 3 adenylate cyclase
MKHEPIRFERERAYPIPVAEAWRLLADTDHLNRTIGLPAVEFSALPDPLLRQAHAKAYGVIPVRWREFPFNWVRERRYVVRREFEGGPVDWIEVGIELIPDGDGVVVRSYAEYTPTGALGRMMRRVARSSVTDVLDYCDRYLARKQAGRPDPVPVPPARPAVNKTLLAQRLAKLAAAPVEPGLIPLLRERITEGSDDQLTGMRPFALAGVWGADRRAVLRLFLHATKAGLVELRWELMCPNCLVPKAETDTLAKLPVRYHCDTCGIAYDADFDQRVELRFSVHPAIRTAASQVYCIGGPLRMPHVLAQQYLPPAEPRRLDLTLAGQARLRTIRGARPLLLTPAPRDSRGREVTISYSSGRWVGPHSLMDGETLTIPDGSPLILRNQTGGPILASIEDHGWTSEATTAAEVTTLQEFRELFSSEVLAPQQQLAISHIAFLFSDLKGSTQLYEGIGDAAAYSRVNRHFDFIREAVTGGGGSVVKTMGDGVMCAFHRLDDALATAITLQREVGAWCQEQGIDPPLTLKVGVHHGPAIVLTANDQLDYFGRTVNLAARLGGQSRGGDLVVLREVLGQAGPAIPAGRPDITAESFTTRLRGIDEEQHLIRLTIAVAPGGTSRRPGADLGSPPVK